MPPRVNHVTLLSGVALALALMSPVAIGQTLEPFEGLSAVSGWTDGNVTTQLETAVVAPGSTQSLQITYGGATGWDAANLLFSTPVDLSATTELRFWARGDAAGQELGLQFLDAAFAGVLYVPGVTLTTSWVEYVIPVADFSMSSPGPDMTQIAAVQMAVTGPAGTLYVDGLRGVTGGATPDAGVVADAGVVVDAGVVADGGPSSDAGIGSGTTVTLVDFELGFDGWTDGNVTTSLQSASVPAGSTQSLEVVYGGSTGWDAANLLFAPVDLRGADVIQLWLRGSAAGQTLALQFTDASFSGTLFTDPISLSTSWTRYELPLSALSSTAPGPDLSAISIIQMSITGPAGTILVDDVTASAAGASTDAGVGSDAGALADSGSSPDAGFVADAGSLADAGVAADAGSASDAGAPDAGATRPVVGTGAPLAALSASGRLEYRTYAAQGQTDAVHILPDFSYAGYHRGGVALPDLPVRETLSPAAGDNRARIQAAIDRVSALSPDANGHRGAVLLTQGSYDVGGTLYIRAGGVVLRGEGQSSSGTILRATQTAQHTLIQVQGAGSGLGIDTGTRSVITTSRVPVGSDTFDVAAGHGFAVGDVVTVLRTPNQAWLTATGMAQYGWTTGSYTIGHERRLTGVSGNTLTVDIPLVDAIEDGYGGGAVYRSDLSGRLSECGVEDLRLDSVYASATDESHGWTGVGLSRVTDSWVRRVTVRHFGFSAVAVEAESNFNTVEEVAMIDPISQVTGSRRYSFYVADGVGNLFQRCYAREGRHDLVSGSRVTGPNVWLDCVAEQTQNDSGPHHRWATGLLFDRVTVGELNVQNRRTSGSGHGWAGAQTLFWNASTTSLICDAPVGSMNWSIGSSGTHAQGRWAPSEPDGWFESHGTPVTPGSLYLQQLEDRLGAAAVEAVTLPAQRGAAGIATEVSAWAGEGRLDAQFQGDPTCSAGIRSGNVCCAASCGSCGGSGCGGRPGGSSACCSGAITSAALSCATHSAPCLIP